MRLSLLAVAALCVSSLAARADTFTTFDLNSTFAGNDGAGTITGTLVLDNTTNLFTSANLLASGFTSGNGALSFLGAQFDNGDQYDTGISGTDIGALSLYLPSSSLVGYSGSAISLRSEFAGAFTDVSLARSGSLTPEATTAAVTPEPSSLALLGTGILGVFGVMKRRFA